MNDILFDSILKHQIEYLDHETMQHSNNVADMVEFIAIKLNYPRSIPNLKKISIFHDIGKNILQDLGYDSKCLLAVEQHHERSDGTGYPYGLSGDKITLGAHIISVCDVVDALLSERPYKQPWSIEKVKEFFYNNLEGFHQPVVDIALKHFDELIALRRYL